jgi:outer membrane protein assembly factor BamB
MSRSSVCTLVIALAAVGAAAPAPASAAPAPVPSNAPLATWQAQGRVRTLAIANGVVYLGGSFTTLFSHGTRDTVVRHHLAAINEATGAPTSWNPNVNGNVQTIRVIGTRVYIGGSFTSVGGRPVRNVAAIDRASGRLAAGFHPAANSAVNALAASSSTLYLGGAFTRVDGAARRHLAAVSLATGALRGPFTAGTSGVVNTLLADTAGGRLYVGGNFARIDGLSRPFLGAVGQLRGVAFRWGTAPLGQVWALALARGGPLYAAVGGHEGGQLDSYTAATGQRRWQRFADGDVQTVALAGNEVLAGGHFLNACGTNQGGGSPWVCTVPVQRDRFFATDASGAIQAWNPGANSLYGVWALRADAGHIVAGGDFTIVDGSHQARYAQFVR